MPSLHWWFWTEYRADMFVHSLPNGTRVRFRGRRSTGKWYVKMTPWTWLIEDELTLNEEWWYASQYAPYQISDWMTKWVRFEIEYPAKPIIAALDKYEETRHVRS